MDLDLLARTTAILGSASILVSLLRRAAPSTRHLVWHLAIVGVILTPVLAPLAPRIAVPGVPRLPTGLVLNTVPDAIAANPVEPGTQQNQTAGTPGTFGTFGTFGALSSGGSVLVGSWFLFCWLLSGLSVWRGSTPAPEQWVNEARAIARRIGMTKDVGVRQMRRDGSPHVAGLFNSIVMMPASASSWSSEARQAALVHELTHIKRRDRRTQAVAQLACAIYWFNPLVWHAAAGLARERERACDDEVLRFGARPSAYATLLLDLARTPSAWTPATALSMARPSALEGRLVAILADAARIPRRSTRWLLGIALITVTTAILGAQTTPPAAASESAAPAIREVKPRPLIPPQRVMAMDTQDTPPSVTGALVEALQDVDGQVREQAALGLAITPGAAVIEPLLNALKDPDAQVREKAATGLAFRRDPRIIDPLLTALDDSDSQVREKAAIALGASGDARAIPALTKATKDPDSQVREKAVAGLVLLGLRTAPGNVERRP